VIAIDHDHVDPDLVELAVAVSILAVIAIDHDVLTHLEREALRDVSTHAAILINHVIAIDHDTLGAGAPLYPRIVSIRVVIVVDRDRAELRADEYVQMFLSTL
jgi:hypothetical protein